LLTITRPCGDSAKEYILKLECVRPGAPSV
jgi:hypothetical protein